MPWVAPHRPSIQLGLLGPAVESAGFEVECLHYYVELCRLLPAAFCREVSERPRLGDWLFSFVFEPKRLHRPNYDEFRAAIGPSVIDPVFPSWREAKRTIEACSRLVSMAVEELIRGRYDVVGFSTMFDQTLASLCVARELKASVEEITIVFGGANVDGGQGAALQKAFEFVDITLAGEADRTFPQLLDALLSGQPLENVPGVFFRRGTDLVKGPPPEPVRELDKIPIPDYDPYFRQIASCGLTNQLPLILQMETSRGCWFGRCLFCGLNRDAIIFRAKSPDRVSRELRFLIERYGILSVCMVDNILDQHYYGTLLPVLAEERRSSHLDFSLFFELKANVRRDDVRQLADAGVRTVQPGIESFDERTLRLVNKGATVHHNIQVLKWCQEFDIHPYYNILYDAPGQTVDDVRRETKAAAMLSHLQPASSVLPVRLQRFSPYFNAPERYGLAKLRPDPCYVATYPLGIDVSGFAYDFVYDSPREGTERDAFCMAVSQLRSAIHGWATDWTPGRLLYSRGPGFVKIIDRRGQRSRSIILRDAAAAVAEECEGSMTLDALSDCLSNRRLTLGSRTIDGLLSEGLLHRQAQRVLFLPVRQRRPQLGTV